MFFLFFFCKQKTAYEMRISDWSSDVCSSDLNDIRGESCFVIGPARHLALCRSMLPEHAADPSLGHRHHHSDVIDTAPSARGAQKFPRAASCRISLSSARSEIARRSRAFTFSRPFIRRASSAEHTSALKSLLRNWYAVIWLTQKHTITPTPNTHI